MTRRAHTQAFYGPAEEAGSERPSGAGMRPNGNARAGRAHRFAAIMAKFEPRPKARYKIVNARGVLAERLAAASQVFQTDTAGSIEDRLRPIFQPLLRQTRLAQGSGETLHDRRRPEQVLSIFRVR